MIDLGGGSVYVDGAYAGYIRSAPDLEQMLADYEREIALYETACARPDLALRLRLPQSAGKSEWTDCKRAFGEDLAAELAMFRGSRTRAVDPAGDGGSVDVYRDAEGIIHVDTAGQHLLMNDRVFALFQDAGRWVDATSAYTFVSGTVFAIPQDICGEGTQVRPQRPARPLPAPRPWDPPVAKRRRRK